MIDSISEEGGAAINLKRARRQRHPAIDPAKLDRLPPHSTEAEQGVLGCILWSPKECLNECITKFGGDREWAYDLRHQTIYDTMVTMAERMEAIDLVTLQQRLKDAGFLDQIGGIAYLSSLQDAVPSAANLSFYLEIVLEKATLRKMIRTCSDIVARAYENEGEVDALMDQAETEILKIAEARVAAPNLAIKELVRKAIGTIEDFHQRKGALTGIPTGFGDLDRMTGGLQGGEMIVFAARPSMGKTSLALGIAEHVAIDVGLSVGVFSLEMTADSLILRMLCSRARVNLRDIREGFMAERDFPKLTATSGKISKAPLYIDDTAGLSILQLRARARRMQQQHGIKLLVVDYLQLMHSTARRAQENRQQEIADISSGIKALAKELNIPVIVLAQLNRELERDRARKPRLSDLRESGSIEQDADVVGLLYKAQSDEDEPDSQRQADAAGIAVNLLIAKQRNGPTGDVHLTFLNSLTRFESRAKVSDEDVPN